MQQTIALPKPMLIGAGALLLLGLFLASGDPGRDERAKLTQALEESNGRITALEARLSEQASQLNNAVEGQQLAQRRLEVSEENVARLRTRLDEIERQMAVQRKQAAAHAAAVAKAASKPATKQPVSKPVSKTNTKTTTATKH